MSTRALALDLIGHFMSAGSGAEPEEMAEALLGAIPADEYPYLREMVVEYACLPGTGHRRCPAAHHVPSPSGAGGVPPQGHAAVPKFLPQLTRGSARREMAGGGHGRRLSSDQRTQGDRKVGLTMGGIMSSERSDAVNLGTRLSTLWVVVMFNMVFADILTFIKPGELQALSAGQAGVHATQGLLLVFAILLEIPIAMIFVSRILKRGPGRWANTVAALITTAFVVGGGSLDLHYVFFATVEIAFMALIVWSAWTRHDSVRARRREPARVVTSGDQPV